MANPSLDEQKNSGIVQMFLAFGGAFFSFLKKIGVVRTEVWSIPSTTDRSGFDRQKWGNRISRFPHGEIVGRIELTVY